MEQSHSTEAWKAETLETDSSESAAAQELYWVEYYNTFRLLGFNLNTRRAGYPILYRNRQWDQKNLWHRPVMHAFQLSNNVVVPAVMVAETLVAAMMLTAVDLPHYLYQVGFWCTTALHCAAFLLYPFGTTAVLVVSLLRLRDTSLPCFYCMRFHYM